MDVGLAHLDRPFDYLVGDGTTVGVGSRVGVMFAGRRRTGWVVGLGDRPESDPARVRPLSAVLSDRAWFDEADLPFLRWVADRYAGTLSDVLRHAMPGRVAGVERRPTAGDRRRPRCGPQAALPRGGLAALRRLGTAAGRRRQRLARTGAGVLAATAAR